MEDNQLNEVPFLSNVGLMLTYKCTIACPHCIVKAGPNRKEQMTLQSAFKWLDQIKAFKDGYVSGISLTGGEPFYNISHLTKIADYANKLGFVVSVVSNAYWATSREEALRVLTLCSSVQMISISADVPHQMYIPFENVKNAIWAAKKLGKLYKIAIATERLDNTMYLKMMDEILEFTDRDFISTSIILPVGRAESNGKSDDYSLSKHPATTACSMASFPIIFPDGKVIACIGPPITLPDYNPLYMGNLQENDVETIFNKAQSNYILHAIRVFGPIALVDLLKSNGFENVLPKEYMDEVCCDVCFNLFSNQNTCRLLEDFSKSDKLFRLKTAYGRYYYLNESEMIDENYKGITEMATNI